MRYVIGCKAVYVILLTSNLILVVWELINPTNPLKGGGVDWFVLFHLKLTIPFLIVNAFIFLKLLQKRVNAIILNLERLLSIGRMMMTLSCVLMVGHYFTGFISPVLYVFWLPLMNTYDNSKGIFGVFYISIFLLICLTLEIYYFIFLNRNEDELRKNLPPKPEPEGFSST